MRFVILLLAAAGCGTAESGPPAGKHAYAREAVEKFVKKRLDSKAARASVEGWGPSWEATAKHMKVMEARGGRLWFPMVLDFSILPADAGKGLPPVAYAVEARVKIAPLGEPDKARVATHLFLFNRHKEIATVAVLDGLPGKMGPGKWPSAIPAEAGLGEVP